MHIRLFIAGKKQDAEFADWIETYCQRSRPAFLVERFPVRTREQMFEKSKSPRILLDERGQNFDSIGFAKWLGDKRDKGVRSLDFLIGDADGFSDAQRKQADELVSLSKMTLPHRLAQLILLEQIYRASTILSGHPYHKI